MDETFKFTINVFAYQHCREFYTIWECQVIFIDHYWDKFIDQINTDELKYHFTKFCKSEHCQTEEYDLHKALLKARNEWRLELMLTTANEIAHDFTVDDVPLSAELVTWNKDIRIMEFIDKSVFK